MVNPDLLPDGEEWVQLCREPVAGIVAGQHRTWTCLARIQGGDAGMAAHVETVHR
jgi:hypothetical protein